MKPVVLVADNNQEYLDGIVPTLEGAGFHVKTASNPQQARNALEEGRIDLAILDVRLDDDTETDASGLEIALDHDFIKIPKIMLSAYKSSVHTLVNVLGQAPERLPYAIDFVEKSRGSDDLVKAVRRALRLWPSIRTAAIDVSQQAKTDYDIVLKQANRNYNLALGVSIIGFSFISLGIVLAFFSNLAIAIVGSASGIVIQVLSYLFFKRLDLSNLRMDSYHRELLETYWLELLLAASERLPLERRIACTEECISAASRRWLGPQARAWSRRELPAKSKARHKTED